MNLTYLESERVDPYWNLALEEHLLFRCGQDERILYLWQNEKTVVIGRNQSAERECPVELLSREGVHLARRDSGGGAVYHDLGNLNFSFFARERQYDVAKQMHVILEALRSLGVAAVFSGRNDILVNGRKISGSAFRQSGSFCCHHGTLMVDVDRAAVERYLRPDPAKLSSKGVASVRARVMNLREMEPEIEIGPLKKALYAAFERTFSGRAEPLVLSDEDLLDVERRRQRFASARWIFGAQRPYAHVLSRRFPWGEVTLRFQTDAGRVADVQVETDAMDPALAERLRAQLLGVRYVNDALSAALSGADTEKELAAWLQSAPLGG